MALTQHRFGQYDVTLLTDGVFEAPTSILFHQQGEAALQSALDRFGVTAIKLVVNCFLLRGPDGISLIDSGLGTAWGDAFGKARGALAGLGITPEQVDRVLLTHLHSDHALGLLDSDSAWLPRAEILVPATDLAFFTDPAARAAQPEAKQQTFDITARVVRAYGGRLRSIEAGPVHGACGAMPGIALVPLPGHTPGHSGYRLRGETDSLLLWADALHMQDVQTASPEVGLIFDVDPQLAYQTRRALLAQLADEGCLVGGGHVSGFARVERNGESFRFLQQ